MRWMAGLLLALILIGCGSAPDIDVSKIDAESILREGDLPAGLGFETGDGDTSKIEPKPDLYASRSIGTNNASAGGISLLVYKDAAQATAFYDKFEKGESLSIGERGQIQTSESSDIKTVTYSFQRCNAVVRSVWLNVMVEIPDERDIESMLNAIDERLRNGPACAK